MLGAGSASAAAAPSRGDSAAALLLLPRCSRGSSAQATSAARQPVAPSRRQQWAQAAAAAQTLSVGSSCSSSCSSCSKWRTVFSFGQLLHAARGTSLLAGAAAASLALQASGRKRRRGVRCPTVLAAVAEEILEVRAGRIRRQVPPEPPEEEEHGEWFSWESDLQFLQASLVGNPINVLLVFVPLSFASGPLGFSSLATFALSFLAIVPLAKLLGEATEQLAFSVGQTLGGLLNATFGNAVEMIIAVYALREGLTEVVKASLVGSIISNLLLVLGMCFLFGGIKYKTQKFSATAARSQYSLLLLAVLALVIPTVVLLTGTRPEMELAMSRGCAVVLALLYVCYLVFQLYTHKDMFTTEAEAIAEGGVTPVALEGSERQKTGSGQEETIVDAAAESEESEEEEGLLSPGSAFLLLFLSTALVAPLSEALTSSINPAARTLGISDAFVGCILLPIVGNAAEHMTAVTVATKNKMDLSLGVALGSSTQIALFVVPFSVLVGWYLGVPMDLNFRALDASIMLLTILIVGSTINDGESHWLEGAALIAAYILIAVSLWYM